MVTNPQGEGRLPAGLFPQEEAAWWDAHQEYWDAQEAPEETVPSPVSAARTRPVTVRLPLAMIDALKEEAARRAIPYQTLMRMWLKEQLDRSAPTAR